MIANNDQTPEIAPAQQAPRQFAKADFLLPDGSLKFCSEYAQLCFTRPADWTRSAILHAGSSQENNIEINPPTGTILRFEAIGTDTATDCSPGYSCTINVRDITSLDGTVSVVAGTITSQPTDTQNKAITRYDPFVQLISDANITTLGLAAGQSTPFETFNTGVSWGTGSAVLFSVSPSKMFSPAPAENWLAGSEARTARTILSSVRPL